MSGVLWGVGVGPGDPELLTLKAVRVLGGVPVIAWAGPLEGESMARRIAAPHLPNGQVEVAMRMPFTPGSIPKAVYDQGAAEIAVHLNAGRDVAVLCEGDPLFFGSFAYVLERLSGHPVRVVPGISSVMACAAALPVPIVLRDEALTVVPATRPEAEMENLLAQADAAVIMKVGRHLPKVLRVLGRLGLRGRARYIERVGWPDQRILSLDEAERDGAPYFSMILLRRG